MRLTGVLVLLLSGCVTASAQARGAFSTAYACADEGITTVDLGQPLQGESRRVVEARGCGHVVKYTCAHYASPEDGDRCVDESQGGTFKATDSTRHALADDAGVASAAHDLSCPAVNVLRVTDTIFDGCGERASYQVLATDDTMSFVLIARTRPTTGGR